MYLGKVVGTVVSTSKDNSLSGAKLLVVMRLNAALRSEGTSEVAVDTVGAGNGEIVIVSCGSGARKVQDDDHTVVDAAVVGIVDVVETVE